MDRTLSTNIGQEIRLLARRAFDVADRAGRRAQAPSATRLCRLVGRLLRQVRHDAFEEPRDRALALVFKLVSDAVALLDALALEAPETRLEASALAAEGSDLADRLFDLLEARALVG